MTGVQTCALPISCSFVANRLNLFLSWCFVIPLFATYLVIHIAAVNRTVRAAARRRLLVFNVNHPDRSGGYAFFGYGNTVYMFGLLTVLIQAFLLVYTHRQIGLANILALAAAGLALVAISFFSIWEIHKAIKGVEIRMKSRDSIERRKEGRPLDTHFFAVLYHINFSAYNYIAARSMLAIRIASFIPAILKLWQYSRQFSN